MKKISADKIKHTVADLCMRANFRLREDVYSRLKNAYQSEKNSRAKELLEAILRNADIAKMQRLAICQDTGMACVFAQVGQELHISGDLRKAINDGVRLGYKKGYLRDSIVRDPLLRGKSGYSPAIIHFELVKGSRIKLTVLPKGFGCENKTRLKMFRPTAGIEEIKKFIIETVKNAGPDACPPYIVGVGIGGTADYACLLAKKAMLKKLNAKRFGLYAKLEASLLKEINNLNLGPMGLGGKATALAVNIETYPTHIAGLAVCVNLSCHALRSATIIL